jgi:hypothetical protein
LPSPEYVAVTGYVPAPSDVAVWQLVAGIVATQSVEPPELKVTVPVAPTGSPESDSVSCEPKTIDDGAAASVNVGVALVMVSVVVVVCGKKFESPEYVAVTVSVPTGALVAVQLSVGSVAVQRVVPPMLKVTDPVALEGSAAVYVTVCVYDCGDGSAVALNALTLTVSLLTAGRASSDEMRAELVTEPLSDDESVTGIVISGKEVPAAIADPGVYVHVTAWPAVTHAQSELLVAVPGVMPVGTVSLTVSMSPSGPPLPATLGARMKFAWLPASMFWLSLSVLVMARSGTLPVSVDATSWLTS